jgi:uncharacterized lipoprotein YajG
LADHTVFLKMKPVYLFARCFLPNEPHSVRKTIILKRLHTFITNVCVCIHTYKIRHRAILTLYRRRMKIIGVTVERTIGENGERDSSVGVVFD